MSAALEAPCLIGAVIAPFVAATVSQIGPRSALMRCRNATRVAWVSAALATVTAVSVVIDGPSGAVVRDARGGPVVGLWADQLTVTLLVLVCVIGALVQNFSVRYLQADANAPRFFATTNIVVAAMAIVCTSATVPVLVGAWVLAGLGFVAVIASRPDLPGVRRSASRTLKTFVIADLGLLAAAAIVWMRAGNVDLLSFEELHATVLRLGSFSTPVAVLIVLSALTRSAQGTFGRWLPGTVSAPTPTSALLHAGLVNGGGILLVRLGVLTGGSAAAMVIAFAVATTTAVVATGVMAHKADVKGALAYSTIAQMGFMIAECSVGAYLAAVVHLVGHGIYKATLFLGSGSQVPRIGKAPLAPVAVMSRVARAVTTAVTTIIAVSAMLAVPGATTHRGGTVLVVFVTLTVVAGGWSWSKYRPRTASLTALWLAGVVGLGGVYGLVLAGLGGWIAPSLPSAGDGVLGPWWLLAILGAGVAMSALVRLRPIKMRLVATLIYLGTPGVQSTL